MSSNGDEPGVDVPQDISFREALMVIGVVGGFVALLLILRYGCNITIDLCFICDSYEVQRMTMVFRSTFCPCFERRPVVPHVATEREASQTQNLDAKSLLASLSDKDRRDVLGVVLTGKVSELFSERTNNTVPLLLFCCIGG